MASSHVYILLFTAVLMQCQPLGDDVKRNDDLDDDDDVHVYKRSRIHQVPMTDNHWGLHPFLSIWRHDNHGHPKDNTECLVEPPTKEFPSLLLTEDQRKHGGILLHLIIAMYACFALGILCDYYFVPSLEIICYHLHIQDDVGGATLMCVGSSVPDIFASIMAILFVDGELGIGTVMGSTAFNLLLVLGVCGLVAYESCTLAWWPFVRDMTSYCVSIIVLSIVITDMLVTWQEALVMVALFCIYYIILLQNQRIEKNIYLLVNDTKSYKARIEDAALKKLLPLGDQKNTNIVDDKEEEARSLFNSDTTEDYDYCGYPTEPPDQPFEFPASNVLKIITWLVVLPIKVIFFLTIPDLRRPKFQKLVSVTFLVGMVWIGILTYILVWMVTVIGHTLGMPDSIIGITFVTFGASVPDLLCSMMVMRREKANMAVSQAIASNPLGILLGLGLPWLIKSAASGQSIHFNSRVDMLLSCAITLVFAVCVLLMLYVKKFELDKRLGMTLVVLYAVYLIGAIIVDVYVGKPTCKH